MARPTDTLTPPRALPVGSGSARQPTARMPGAAPGVPRGPHVLLGRGPELARLAGALASPRCGRGGVVVVTGVAGVGKTALVAAAARQAAADGLRVRWVATERDGGGSQLLGPVRDLLAGGPSALVVDDLQWADAGCLARWHALAAAAAERSLLLVGIVRTPAAGVAGLAPALRPIAAGPHAAVEVGPLPTAAARDLARRLAGDVGTDDSPGLDEALTVAAGNPRYVTELAVRLPRPAPPGDPAATGHRPVLADIVEAVAARAGVLHPAVTTVVRAASLVDGPTSVSELAAVLGMPAHEVEPAVTAAAEAGLLLPHRGELLRFRHDLLRAAVHDAMPQAVRAALHEHVALALADGGADVERVARHLALGPPALRRRSVEWLLQVAPVLVQRAPELAAALLESALPSLVADDPRRPATALLLAHVRIRTGDPAAASDLLAGLLRGSPGRGVRRDARRALGFARLALGDAAGAAAALADEAADVPLSPPTAGGSPGGPDCAFLALSAWAHLARGRVGDAGRDAAEVLDTLEPANPPALLAAATAGVVALLDHRGEDGIRVLDRAVDAMAGTPGPPAPAWDDPRPHVLHAAGWTLLGLDRCGEAARRFEEGVTLAERHHGALLPWLRVGVALHRYLTGRWDEAVACVRTGLVEPSVSGSHRMLRAVEALVAAGRDLEPPPADDDLAEPSAPPHVLASWAWEQWVAHALAARAERAGDPGRGLALLTAHVRRDTLTSVGSHVVRPTIVRLALAVGERDLARAEHAAARADAAAQPTPARRAGAAWSEGMLGGDPRPLLAAARLYRRAGHHPVADRVLEDVAVQLAAAGRPLLARPAVRRAADGYAARGAAWDRARLQHRLREHGVRIGSSATRGRDRSGWESLSPTERAVARLVAEGLSNPQIADHMLIARRTVATHVSHVLRKLDLRSRTEVAAAAVRCGAAGATP